MREKRWSMTYEDVIRDAKQAGIVISDNSFTGFTEMTYNGKCLAWYHHVSGKQWKAYNGKESFMGTKAKVADWAFSQIDN